MFLDLDFILNTIGYTGYTVIKTNNWSHMKYKYSLKMSTSPYALYETQTHTCYTKTYCHVWSYKQCVHISRTRVVTKAEF